MTRIGSLKISRGGKVTSVAVYKRPNGAIVYKLPSGSDRRLSPLQLGRYTLSSSAPAPKRKSSKSNMNRSKNRADFERRRNSLTENSMKAPTKIHTEICKHASRDVLSVLMYKLAGKESYLDSKDMSLYDLCSSIYARLMIKGYTETEIKNHILKGKRLPRIN